MRCTDIIADEREGKEVAADEPADDILVTEAPSGAPPSETGVLKLSDNAQVTEADRSARKRLQNRDQTVPLRQFSKAPVMLCESGFQGSMLLRKVLALLRK